MSDHAVNEHQDEIAPLSSGISFTRRRTTTKTRNAASSARRRKNIPLCHASGEGGGDVKDQHSWFARKSAGWTDDDIRNHLVSGGSSGGGEGVSLVGDVIVGPEEKKRKKPKQRRQTAKFAWEEEGDEDQDDYRENNNEYENGGATRGRIMSAAPPTVLDIMDEKDKIDFMPPIQLGQEYGHATSVNTKKKLEKSETSKNESNLRTRNAALEELAQVSGFGGGAPPTSANESIGLRLLRIWGYSSRLRVAFLPIPGKEATSEEIEEELEKAGVFGKQSHSHETKWLASKRLRAVHLPSILNDEPNLIHGSGGSGGAKNQKKQVLRIPPPKNNRHGMGYDPFRNAPEFREFHERRRLLAKKRGRAADDSARGDAGGKDSKWNRRDKYYTDDIGKDSARGDKGGIKGLWDDNDITRDRDDSDGEFDGDKRCNMSDDGKNDVSYFAADNNYSDFIGTKSSSGFALEDEDDANVYQDDTDHDFRPRSLKNNSAAGEYALEVQSPLASDEESNEEDTGLFGRVSTGVKLVSKINEKESFAHGARSGISVKEAKEFANAWNSWGGGTDTGISDPNSSAFTSTVQIGDNITQRKMTLDGKAPLSGFLLEHKKIHTYSEVQNTPNRWKGPIVPSGYVLKRHVFETSNHHTSDTIDKLDTGLGLDLHARKNHPSIPRANNFLPNAPIFKVQNEENKQPSSGKMLAKNGAELDFHAVKESMKNRFVSSMETSDNSANNHSTASNNRLDPETDRDRDKDEKIAITFKTWIPTRLLCKRWGVQYPTIENARAVEENVDNKKEGEDVYFRQVVCESVLQKNVAKSNVALKESEKQKQNVNLEMEDGVYSGPPPSRPTPMSTIFEAVSDMDISSSEDESSVADVIHADEKSSETLRHSSQPNEESTPSKTSCVTNVDSHHLPSAQTQRNQCPQPPPLSDDTTHSSISDTSRRSRKRRDRDRRNWRRSKSRSISPPRKSRATKHSNKNGGASSGSDEWDSYSHDSDEKRKSKKRKKHRHHSRSRHREKKSKKRVKKERKD